MSLMMMKETHGRTRHTDQKHKDNVDHGTLMSDTMHWRICDMVQAGPAPTPPSIYKGGRGRIIFGAIAGAACAPSLHRNPVDGKALPARRLPLWVLRAVAKDSISCDSSSGGGRAAKCLETASTRSCLLPVGFIRTRWAFLYLRSDDRATLEKSAYPPRTHQHVAIPSLPDDRLLVPRTCCACPQWAARPPSPPRQQRASPTASLTGLAAGGVRDETGWVGGHGACRQHPRRQRQP